MADNLQAYKVAANEQSSSSKFNNYVQAVEDAVNSLDNSNVSAAAAILVSKLASGSNGDVLQTIAGVPTWGAPSSGGTYQTTLPGSPTNGQITYYVDSTTAPTYCWVFRYNSAKSSNKWDFIGGSPIVSRADASQTVSLAGSSWVSGYSPDPAITLPLAGTYQISGGAQIAPVNAASVAVGIRQGSTDPTFDGVLSAGGYAAAAQARQHLQPEGTLTAAASTALALRIWHNFGGSMNVVRTGAYLRALPVAVGG